VIMLPVVVTAILTSWRTPRAGLQPGRNRRRGPVPEQPEGHPRRGLHFRAVGIGFAAGVGTLAIAAFLSVFFCVLSCCSGNWIHRDTSTPLACLPAGAPPARERSLPSRRDQRGTRRNPRRAGGASGDASWPLLRRYRPAAMGGGNQSWEIRACENGAKRPAERSWVLHRSARPPLAEAVPTRYEGLQAQEDQNGGTTNSSGVQTAARRKSPAAPSSADFRRGQPYIIARSGSRDARTRAERP